MFNLFKKKIELKNNNTLIDSVDYKRGIKIGSEISVPNHFECLIFSKNKYFATLKEGKYKLDENLLPTLIKSQQKKLKKLRNIKLVAHYISGQNHQLEILAKKQKYVVDFCIKDSLIFAEFVLLFNYKVDTDYTLNYLREVFHELLIYNKLNPSAIESSALEHYGIHINSFTLQNSKKSIFKNKDTIKPSINQNQQEIANLSPDINDAVNTDTANTSQQQNEQNSAPNTQSNPSLYTCPNCGQSIRFKTTYCIKCGSTLTLE